MIVYYNPQDFSLTGMSASLNSLISDPYIETDDPVAEQIFLRKEKIFNYRVDIIDQNAHAGRLVKRVVTPLKSANSFKILDYQYLVPNNAVGSIDFLIIQDTGTKTIRFKLNDSTLKKWEQEYANSSIFLIACIPNDPYSMLWFLKLVPDNIYQTFNYAGQDNICFYTKKLFENYQHVNT